MTIAPSRRSRKRPDELRPIVARLCEAGFDRYMVVDYRRNIPTYYLPDGENAYFDFFKPDVITAAIRAGTRDYLRQVEPICVFIVAALPSVGEALAVRTVPADDESTINRVGQMAP